MVLHSLAVRNHCSASCMVQHLQGFGSLCNKLDCWYSKGRYIPSKSWKSKSLWEYYTDSPQLKKFTWEILYIDIHLSSFKCQNSLLVGNLHWVSLIQRMLTELRGNFQKIQHCLCSFIDGLFAFFFFFVCVGVWLIFAICVLVVSRICMCYLLSMWRF